LESLELVTSRVERDEGTRSRRLYKITPAGMAFVADTLTNKLLHAPSKALRSGDAVEQSQLMDAAEKLFDLPPVDA